MPCLANAAAHPNLLRIMSTSHRDDLHTPPFFDFHQNGTSWSIHDTDTGEPVVIDGRPQTGLNLDEADELTAVLNRVKWQAAALRAGRER